MTRDNTLVRILKYFAITNVMQQIKDLVKLQPNICKKKKGIRERFTYILADENKRCRGKKIIFILEVKNSNFLQHDT